MVFTIKHWQHNGTPQLIWLRVGVIWMTSLPRSYWQSSLLSIAVNNYELKFSQIVNTEKINCHYILEHLWPVTSSLKRLNFQKMCFYANLKQISTNYKNSFNCTKRLLSMFCVHSKLYNWKLRKIYVFEKTILHKIRL